MEANSVDSHFFPMLQEQSFHGVSQSPAQSITLLIKRKRGFKHNSKIFHFFQLVCSFICFQTSCWPRLWLVWAVLKRLVAPTGLLLWGTLDRGFSCGMRPQSTIRFAGFSLVQKTFSWPLVISLFRGSHAKPRSSCGRKDIINKKERLFVSSNYLAMIVLDICLWYLKWASLCCAIQKVFVL